MVKIAVATTDGKIVNQHFGKAEQFYILNVDEEAITYDLTEIRHTGSVCQGGDHEDTRLLEVISALKDCDYVLVSRIGMRARNILEKSGIDAYEIPGVVEESVDKLIRFSMAQGILT
jgi:predicted Fe-Mo cluster-binding NifX family protein